MSIQYLRAVAALAVVWCHAYLELEKISSIGIPDWFDGRAGVDLFFVISGFIIWTATYDRREGALGFWYRRLTRILPLYWLGTLAMVGLLLVLPQLFERPHLDVGHVLLSLLFVPHMDPFVPDQTYPLLQVGWTLNYEMFFYALFGFFLWLRPANRVAAVVLLLGGLVTLGAVFELSGVLWSTYTNPLLLEFLAGVTIGYIFTSRWRPDAGFGWSLILLAVFGYIGLNQGLVVEPIKWRALCWGVPAIILVAGVVTVERASGAPDVRFLDRLSVVFSRLGDASYAIYLSHPFTLGALRWVFDHVDGAADLPPSFFIGMALLTSSFVGLAVHFVVERPLIRALGRRKDRRSGSSRSLQFRLWFPGLRHGQAIG